LIHVLLISIFMMNITVYILIILHFILTFEISYILSTFILMIKSIGNIFVAFLPDFRYTISHVLDIVRVPHFDSIFDR